MALALWEKLFCSVNLNFIKGQIKDNINSHLKRLLGRLDKILISTEPGIISITNFW